MTKVCAIDGEVGNHDKRIHFDSVFTFWLSVYIFTQCFSLIVQQVLSYSSVDTDRVGLEFYSENVSVWLIVILMSIGFMVFFNRNRQKLMSYVQVFW